MSDSLVWHLIRNNNCFLKTQLHTKRAGAVQFSSESGNLLSVNSFKYSGLANSKTIDLSVKDKTVQLSFKASKKINKPAKSIATVPLRKNDKKSLKTISSVVGSAFYRADLASAAKARYLRLYRDVRIKKGLIKGARAKNGRNSRSAA